MNWVTIGLSAGTLLGMAVILTYILGWANKTFRVEVDPRIAAVLDSLPGANCGGCGYIGCREYAEAVVAGKEPVNKCSVGGKGCAAALAEIMGIELAENYPYRPIVHCGAHYGDRLGRSDYRGRRHAWRPILSRMFRDAFTVAWDSGTVKEPVSMTPFTSWMALQPWITRNALVAGPAQRPARETLFP